jgi:hypothetical protein
MDSTGENMFQGSGVSVGDNFWNIRFSVCFDEDMESNHHQ